MSGLPTPKKLKVLDDPSRDSTYSAVNSSHIHHIAIFPPLGISRVGDSDECFLAPEVPGHTSPPESLKSDPESPVEYMFRDRQQKLRRQAVRFRAYAYCQENDGKYKVLGELNKKNGYTLTWTVNVANKKAAGYIDQATGRFGPHNKTLRNPMVQPDDVPDKRDRLIVKADGMIPTTKSQDFVHLQGEFKGSKETPTNVELGQLQLDSADRLVFIPAKGNARSIANATKPYPQLASAFDSADWIDEICDGIVEVKVEGNNILADVPVLGARVLSAPPNFAWGINPPTTLYDIMENTYREAGNQRVPAPNKNNLDFWKHIWPVLHSASLLSWTDKTALRGHGPFSNGNFDSHKLFKLFKGADVNLEERKQFKARIFEKLRKPLDESNIDNSQADVRYMPLLSGDIGDKPNPGDFPPDLKPDARRFAALMKLQHERFKIWKENDDFHLTGDNPPTPPSQLEVFPVADQPEQLTRAILESTVGDPLLPGMETDWIAKVKEIYDTTETRIDPPFRIADSVPLGRLTQGLSMPWQSDFYLCHTHWWPAIRPDDVVSKAIFDGTVQDPSDESEFNTAITTRTKWARGLRYTDLYSASQTEWPGSEDMIRYWTHLGVLREVKGTWGGKPGSTVFLEDERRSL